MRVYLLVLPPLSYIHSGTNLLISCISEVFCQNQPGLDHQPISIVENLVSRVSRRSHSLEPSMSSVDDILLKWFLWFTFAEKVIFKAKKHTFLEVYEPRTLSLLLFRINSSKKSPNKWLWGNKSLKNVIFEAKNIDRSYINNLGNSSNYWHFERNRPCIEQKCTS